MPNETLPTVSNTNVLSFSVLIVQKCKKFIK